ncbi:acyl-CoA thioesterase, partial [Clostridium botulinum]|nr:acyl-CoA thioesterase [Clostridium botulinum]
MYINRTETTVRYVETDQMGVVHHSNYYPWFEMGRTEFPKATGMK